MINIFGLPIYFNNIKINEKDKHKLVNLKYERLGINNGHISKNKYVLEDKKYLNLKKIVMENLNNYLYNELKIKKDIKFKMLNSWCVKHLKNDWSHKHHHENSFVSGILYIRTFENSGDLVLHRNKSLNLFPDTVTIDFEEFNLINAKSFSLKPKDGDIVFFPSQLEHSVTENLSEEYRYCCAFNFYPEGIFGNENNLNQLKI